jgi:hypothetical protein
MNEFFKGYQPRTISKDEDGDLLGSYLCWPVQGDWLITGCEAHTNFADESVHLLVSNIQNEVITIHRSQEALKMLSLYM